MCGHLKKTRGAGYEAAAGRDYLATGTHRLETVRGPSDYQSACIVIDYKIQVLPGETNITKIKTIHSQHFSIHIHFFTFHIIESPKVNHIS